MDMKEALDLRDAGVGDPALYAAKALESTLKIISDIKGWTHGGEKGAHNYIDNLGSKTNRNFIEAWERDALKAFFLRSEIHSATVQAVPLCRSFHNRRPTGPSKTACPG